MEMIDVAKLIPYILSAVEVFKRLIPGDSKAIAVPVLAGIAGIVAVNESGITADTAEIISYGLLAGLGAIGTYKLPKELCKIMGVPEKGTKGVKN